MNLPFDIARCGGRYLHTPTYEGWHPECESCRRRTETVHNPNGQWHMGPPLEFIETCKERISP